MPVLFLMFSACVGPFSMECPPPEHLYVPLYPIQPDDPNYHPPYDWNLQCGDEYGAGDGSVDDFWILRCEFGLSPCSPEGFACMEDEQTDSGLLAPDCRPCTRRSHLEAWREEYCPECTTNYEYDYRGAGLKFVELWCKTWQ